MTKPMPVRIRGVDYPTAADAAKALGVKQATIYSALYRNTLDTVGTGSGRLKKNARGGKPRPIVLGTMKFRTIQEASLFLGYEKRSLSKILRVGGDHARQNVMRRLLEKTAQQENSRMNRDVITGYPRG